MQYRPQKFLFLIVALVIAPFVVGCQPDSGPAAADASATVTPKESFEAIVALLRDGLELPGGTASGFVTSSSNSRSRFQVHTEVASELLPPTEPGKAYHGIITVTTQSLYSLHTTEKKKDDEEDGDSQKSGSPLDQSADSGTGFNTFDQGLVSEAADKQTKSDEVEVKEEVHRQENRDERKFELIYRNKRWELLIKTDPDTEASIQNAFDRALRLQPR